MGVKLIALGVFVGFILFLASRESKRNDVYNQTKLEDEKSTDDERNDTDH
jgi:hypothetical protein